MSKRAVRTNTAPSPVASYSQAVLSGELVQVSGQGPMDPETGRFVQGGIKEQARQTLENLRNILAAAGGSFQDALMVRVYLSDPEDFPVLNEVYAEFVSEPHPARTTVYVGLPAGMLVEIDVLAAVGRDCAEGTPA